MIFLDNNATTPLAKEVSTAMHTHMGRPLNPSSVHAYGREAKRLLLEAKQSFASLLKINTDEIIFTSGGTESMNLLIKGLYQGSGKILTSDLEHPCIAETLNSMNLKKGTVITVSPSTYGAPRLEDIEPYLQEDISLMVFSAVYSETGVKLDLEKFAAFAESLNIPFVVDGVAFLGKENLTILSGITGMGFSAHKLHGPLGVGAAFISARRNFKPSIYGGSQQMKKRAGTENLLGIIGFEKALQLFYSNASAHTAHMEHLKKLFLSAIENIDIKVHINGDGDKVCNTLNLYFEGIDGETLLLALDRQGVAVSMGSACSSGSIEPSKVLINMGYDYKRAKNSLRFSWSRYTSDQDIKKALHILCETLKLLTPVKVSNK